MSQSATARFEKVKAIYARELEQQDVVTDITQIPASYELISDEWLTRALCARVPGARVTSHRLDTPDEGTSNRRKWEMDLIHHYLECLAAEGATPLPFDQTLLVYRQQLFCALAMWTSTLCPAPGSPEIQPPETSIEFIKRMARAMDDLDSLASICATP